MTKYCKQDDGGSKRLRTPRQANFGAQELYNQKDIEVAQMDQSKLKFWLSFPPISIQVQTSHKEESEHDNYMRQGGKLLTLLCSHARKLWRQSFGLNEHAVVLASQNRGRCE